MEDAILFIKILHDMYVLHVYHFCSSTKCSTFFGPCSVIMEKNCNGMLGVHVVPLSTHLVDIILHFVRHYLNPCELLEPSFVQHFEFVMSKFIVKSAK